MRNTFHVSFISHNGLRRKYCFSVAEPETKARWGALLRRQIAATRSARSETIETAQQRIRQAAEAVSLTVLRDATIAPDEKESRNPNVSRVVRAGSVSVAYDEQAGKNEKALGPLQAGKAGGVSARLDGMMELQTGKELVLLCRQNSLLPGLLELLQAGIEGSTKHHAGGRV